MSGATNSTDQEGPTIHGVFPYISLVFKLTLTVIIIMMATLVCVTIKKTGTLHWPHNFLVANVMVADIVLSLWSVLPATISLIGAATGTDLNYCGLINFAFHPVIAYHITFLMISIDKVIAIASPYKHQHIMTHRVVAGMICISWLLAIIISFHTLFVHQITEVPEYSICILPQSSFLRVILTYAIPIITEASITTALNMYLAIKAYQVHRQIQKETRLSGATDQTEALQQKRRTIKKHMKPILTLLVILLGNSLISIVFISIYIPGQLLITHSAYLNFMRYVIRPNIIYFSPLLHPIAYGFHFKQIREPMKKIVLSWYTRCKQNTATVAPQY